MKSQTNTNTDSNADARRLFKNKNTIIRDINYCLAPCNQCTGLYIDSIRGDILRIVCHHKCHFDTKYNPAAAAITPPKSTTPKMGMPIPPK